MPKTTRAKKKPARSKRSTTRRTKWTDVFHSQVPGHAQLVASMLDAIGLEVSLRTKKPGRTRDPVPHVRVLEAQAGRAREILNAYGLM